MKLFILYVISRFFQQYPDKEELLRNMMGLLGNVAEVESLRSQLMKEKYVMVFYRLLRSKSDGIEVRIIFFMCRKSLPNAKKKKFEKK